MAIGGIRGNYSNYQSVYNDFRLQSALQKNTRYQNSTGAVQRVNNVSSYSGAENSIGFIKEYNSVMSDLMKSANSLRDSNSAGVMSDLAVSSSEQSVASATEKYGIKTEKNLTLDVTQIAQAQENISTGVSASEIAVSDINMNIRTSSGQSIDVSVSNRNESGTKKSSYQMLKETAEQINNLSDKSLLASVVEKDGIVSLKISGKETGSQKSFAVTGDMGVASGADIISKTAQDAKYSVTNGTSTTEYTSDKNQVSLDLGRIGVELKSVGKTSISASPDSEKISKAVDDFVKNYNNSLKLLNDNVDRGTGVERQLRNLLVGMGSEDSLKKAGITTKKDGTLEFDKSTFEKNFEKDPKLTKDILGGSFGLGQTAFNKASSALSTNSFSLINNDARRIEEESYSSPLGYMNLVSKGGAYNMNNYYALGMMVNYLA